METNAGRQALLTGLFGIEGVNVGVEPGCEDFTYTYKGVTLGGFYEFPSELEESRFETFFIHLPGVLDLLRQDGGNGPDPVLKAWITYRLQLAIAQRLARSWVGQLKHEYEVDETYASHSVGIVDGTKVSLDYVLLVVDAVKMFIDEAVHGQFAQYRDEVWGAVQRRVATVSHFPCDGSTDEEMPYIRSRVSHDG